MGSAACHGFSPLVIVTAKVQTEVGSRSGAGDLDGDLGSMAVLAEKRIGGFEQD
jgi:hypothetical protein